MSGRYGRVLAALVNGLTVPQRGWHRAHTRLQVANALFQQHAVETRQGTLVFVSTHPQALLFPQYHATREPETIDWIDGFAAPATFWDIGANVGEFTLYAALQPGISVLAFEPAAASYAALCRNIAANGCGDRVQAYCVALDRKTRLGSLNLSSAEPGGHGNAFAGGDGSLGRPRIGARQATIGFAIDDFRRQFAVPAPNYLKIDVDGTEEEILAGAAGTLADPALRSLLVELEEADTPRKARIAECLAAAGFRPGARGAGQGGVANLLFVRR
jgi:FkbM family methyltransferase